LKPHSSIDILEFAKLYHKNSRIWNKAFEFLRNTNLDTISPGKYQILGDSVFASITENPTKTMDQSKWEFHKKYTDIQLVAKGKEKIGVTPVQNVIITDAFNESKDIAFGTYNKGDYYDIEPGVFLLFFPTDGHRPGLKLEGCDKNKKVVIKVLTH
jgi:YhcH/YjgK/YiaL family protein